MSVQQPTKSRQPREPEDAAMQSRFDFVVDCLTQEVIAHRDRWFDDETSFFMPGMPTERLTALQFNRAFQTALTIVAGQMAAAEANRTG